MFDVRLSVVVSPKLNSRLVKSEALLCSPFEMIELKHIEHKKSGQTGRFTLRRLRRSLDDYHSFFFVKVLEHDFDNFAFLSWHKFANVVGLDWEFAMFFTAVDKNRKLYTPRTS